MATLDPEEIESLMQAISDGRIGQSDPEDPAPSFMDAAPTAANPADIDAKAFDLTNPARNIPEPMPGLEAANDELARLFSGAVSGRTRKRIKVRHRSVERTRWIDMMPLLAPPSVLGIMDTGLGTTNGVAIISDNLAEGLMLAGLGARDTAGGLPGENSKTLTNVERSVVKRILSYLAEALGKAYRPVVRLNPKVLRIEPDPRLAVTAEQKDMALLSLFEISGDMEGEIQIALPFSVFEAKRDRLKGPKDKFDGRVGADGFSRDLREAMDEVPLDFEVELGRTKMSLNKFLALGVGDIFTLRTDERTPLRVTVEGLDKMRGFPAVENGSLAVVLQDGLQMSGSRALTALPDKSKNPFEDRDEQAALPPG